MKDTQENEPVASIEEDIQAAIDATVVEEVSDEIEEEQSDDVEGESEEDVDGESAELDGETDESSDEELSDESDESEEDDDDGDGEPETDGEDGEDKLEAPEHWAAAHKEVFNSQTKEAQEFLLERHKEMEGAFTRKSQELASKTRQFDAVEDALAPYQHEFAAAGLDNAGAVRQLASWHNALKTGGKQAVLKLAETYGIDLAEESDEYVDPALATIQQKLSALENQTAQQQQAAQREHLSQLERVIADFAEDTDESGQLKHPHFNTLHDDIVRLFNGGLAKDLPDAYTKALAFHPELQAPKKTVTTPKPDQAEKVRKAKKAATGLKSSGATKRKRADMTLEEEIAAHF